MSTTGKALAPLRAMDAAPGASDRTGWGSSVPSSGAASEAQRHTPSPMLKAEHFCDSRRMHLTWPAFTSHRVHHERRKRRGTACGTDTAQCAGMRPISYVPAEEAAHRSKISTAVAVKQRVPRDIARYDRDGPSPARPNTPWLDSIASPATPARGCGFTKAGWPPLGGFPRRVAANRRQNPRSLTPE